MRYLKSGSFGWLLLGLSIFLVGCSDDSPTASNTASTQSNAAKPIDSVTLMLNWYPEAEHGGFYAAKVHGIFEQHGLQVEIRSGGPTAPVAQEMVIGRVQFGIANADDVLNFRQSDVDVVALLAPIQDTPRCILVRESSGITGLDGLKGLTLQANKGQAFLDFMQSKGHLEGVQVVPYTGSVANFVADSKTAIQAYSFSEPLLAEQQGVKVRALMLGDIGFNPYASCLIATRDFINKNPDLVRRMVVACNAGWQKYLEAPEMTNAAILAANSQGMTQDALAFGVEKLRPLCLPAGMKNSEVGKMSLERWQQLVDQFIALKLVSADKVKASEAFQTTE